MSYGGWLWLLMGPLLAQALPFSNGEGLQPLQVGGGFEGSLSAESCKNCHLPLYRQWRQSRHAQSWSNALFQEGFQWEPVGRCLHCHAPLSEQLRELASRRRGPGLHHRGSAPTPVSAPLAEEGINCITCHVRGGRIHAAQFNQNVLHPTTVDPSLRDPTFCKNCHQFRFDEVRDGRLHLGEQKVQSTYDEWVSYRAAGGTETCQSCHMPHGSHRFAGAHDRELLRRVLRVDWETAGEDTVLRLSLEGIGHAFPTGDLFRHLTVEIKGVGAREFETIAYLGKRFRVEPATGDRGPIKVLESDTTLKPGEVRRIALPAGCGYRLRIRYHYGSAENERRSVLSPLRFLATLVERPIPCPGALH